MTEEMVCQYLRAHPGYLEKWVMEEVALETLELWMIRRTQRDKDLKGDPGSKISRKTSLSRWKFCVHADKRKMLEELTHSLQTKPKKACVLWELSQCISSAVNADEFHLYLADSDSLKHYQPTAEDNNAEETFTCSLEEEKYVCSYVAATRQTVRQPTSTYDERFPEMRPFNKDNIQHILCIPVIQSDGELAAVLELDRTTNQEAFHEEDEEIANSYLVWGGIALHYAELYTNMAKQRKLNDFMLSVVKSIFQDMVSMDTLIMKVMNFAQRLVNADRASLFLVDHKNHQLYARIFDIGSEAADQANSSSEIRFAIGTGIAGIVAQTGQALRIKDAYSDERFNRNVDQITGYVTKSILCMPIFIRGNVIGVMQMVNKSTGMFTKEDEESFEMFAVYCGLALHHAKLYDKIRRSEQKYKVALEVLSYHNTCTSEELETLKTDKLITRVPKLDDFYFNPLTLGDMEKVRHTIYMFVDLFGLVRFEKDCLIRFCLTVKKNYRRVPYHNWTHGFSVANSMYALIKASPKSFKPLECLSLFVGCLCHDLDHRGKNNKFLLETDSPLAAIYTTSTLEHHHFNQTITILQQEGHNIFSKLTNTEYKMVLGNIKHCILATDLALFFPNKEKLSVLVQNNSYNWDNPEHRLVLEAVTMTACDLCAAAKPWDIQVETVKVIFEEFYEQGDAERIKGKKPIPMMDRNKIAEQPSSQVGFLSGICIPCYDLIGKLIPPACPLLEGCLLNLEKWKELADEMKARENEKMRLAEELAKLDEKKLIKDIVGYTPATEVVMPIEVVPILKTAESETANKSCESKVDEKNENENEACPEVDNKSRPLSGESKAENTLENTTEENLAKEVEVDEKILNDSKAEKIEKENSSAGKTSENEIMSPQSELLVVIEEDAAASNENKMDSVTVVEHSESTKEDVETIFSEEVPISNVSDITKEGNETKDPIMEQERTVSVNEEKNSSENQKLGKEKEKRSEKKKKEKVTIRKMHSIEQEKKINFLGTDIHDKPCETKKLTHSADEKAKRSAFQRGQEGSHPIIVQVNGKAVDDIGMAEAKTNKSRSLISSAKNRKKSGPK